MGLFLQFGEYSNKFTRVKTIVFTAPTTRPAYPQIDGYSDILGTLYNLGDRANPPNTNPKPNPFGENVKKEYHYMQKLLGHNH